MEVSRSGYYAWQKRPPSARTQANAHLTQQIQNVHQDSDQTYGSPRVFAELRAQGVACSEKRIARLMRQADLKAVCPQRFGVTTHSDHGLPIADNLLARAFDCPTPNARWTADITYLWTGQGWLYLAIVLDLFSRRVVGWAMDTTLERSLVLAALDMALQGRRPQAGLLCPRDRGSQYASLDYHKTLQDAGAVCSMSRPGNCWDNAPTEVMVLSAL
jgi:putative transposase